MTVRILWLLSVTLFAGWLIGLVLAPFVVEAFRAFGAGA